MNSILLHFLAAFPYHHSTHYNKLPPLRHNHSERKGPIRLRPLLIAPIDDVHHVQQSTRMQKKRVIFPNSTLNDIFASAPHSMPSTHADLDPSTNL